MPQNTTINVTSTRRSYLWRDSARNLAIHAEPRFPSTFADGPIMNSNSRVFPFLPMYQFVKFVRRNLND